MVKKILTTKAPGVNEIHRKMLKVLNTVKVGDSACRVGNLTAHLTEFEENVEVHLIPVQKPILSDFKDLVFSLFD